MDGLVKQINALMSAALEWFDYEPVAAVVLCLALFSSVLMVVSVVLEFVGERRASKHKYEN